MIPALLASVFFACSGVCGQRSVLGYGALKANFIRLLIACVLLGGVTFVVNPDSFSNRVTGWLALSGLIGFGIGDVALYVSYGKIGSRTTLLIYLCSAPIFGAVADWACLGAVITGVEWIAGGVILSGVGLVFFASGETGNGQRRSPRYVAGVLFSLVAGVGQGVGATTSRIADEIAKLEGLEVGGFSMAFQRVVAGTCFGGLVYLISRKRRGEGMPPLPIRRRTLWILGAAVFGPFLGVSCFQWALIGGTPSALVLAITATSPLLIIPLAYFTENDRPGRIALVGSAVAVSGVIWLCSVQ